MARERTAHRRARGSGGGGRPSGKFLNEIIGLLLFGLGAVILLALISYNAGDPSWNTTGRDRPHNWIGPVGALLADTLYTIFGWAAIILPLALFALAWWRVLNARPPFSRAKIIGLLLLVLALTGLLSLAELDGASINRHHLGGLVGHALVHGDYGLTNFLNATGSAIVLLVTLLSGLILATPFTLFGMLVHLTPREQEAGLLTALSDRFRAWRQLRAAERARTRAERMPTPPPPAREEKPEEPKPERRSRFGLSALLGRSKEPAAAEKPAPFDLPDETGASARLVKPAAAPPPRAVAEVPPRVRPATSSLNAANAAAPVTPARGVKAIGRPFTEPPEVKVRGRVAPELPPREDDFETGPVVEEPALPPDLIRRRRQAEEARQHAPDGGRSVAEMLATASVARASSAEPAKRAESKAAPLIRNLLRTTPDHKLPSTEMLTAAEPRPDVADTELMERAQLLAQKCNEFNVSGQVKQISPGPVVTTFEFKLDPGVKYGRVTSLVDDLCLGLKAESIRIDRIPGKSTVGIEVPNQQRETIRLREVIESQRFRESPSKLTVALGKTIDGSNYIADLTRMPHLLIAGATGAGKSVALNTLLISLLFKATPEEVKLILIDPKRLELGLYADIPYLLTPIVTDPKRASYSLKWAVSEMESRYKHLASFGVRNIEQYNREVCSMVDRNLAEANDELPRMLPYIVIVIDELADLMMISARDVEESITRLAQMARAVGIHLVLATQRPSTDVITGLIKANFPSRISFRVSSKVDSRVIIDTNGAEGLLGQGDMLFLPPGTSRLIRVHGAYVDEKEVKRIADFVRAQGQPEYNEKIQMSEREVEGEDLGELPKDEKYDEALRIVIEMGRASTSVLQRRLRIGYGRAASIIDRMHREGIVGPEDGSKPRQVLVRPDDRAAFLERLAELREDEAD
jgi:S-DNA-T family DNA segregation ATPase FtsK/SpoIIIE